MNKIQLAAIFLVVFLSGCSTHAPLYEWCDYEETLFAAYSYEPDLRQEAIDNYLQTLDKPISNDVLIAPGLFAEAGTFMLERGDLESAIYYYKKEYEEWPESRPMMEALIRNLEGKK